MFNKMRIILSEVGRGISIIVAPRGTGTTVSFTIPGRVAIAILVLIGILIAALAFSGYTYARLTGLVLRLGRLERENAVLRSEVEKIEEIRAQIAEVRSMRRKIESWAGLLPEAGQGEEGAASTEAAYIYVPMWPRRYSYEIMREAYLHRSSMLPDMIVPTTGWVSRWFIEGEAGETTHPGVDIVAATGTPVRCALDGEVTFAGWDDVYGNVVRVQHNDSIMTVYGHNDRILVREGKWVVKGEVIARVGSTGRSTAPHLHFEVLKNGIAENPRLYVNLGHKEAQGNEGRRD